MPDSIVKQRRKRSINRRTVLLITVIVIVAVLAAVIVTGSLITPEMYAENFQEKKQAPSWEHPFGTDAVGRDMLFRSLKGLSASLGIGMFSAIVGAGLAMILGLAAALLGPKVDGIITWMVDLCMSIPHMVLLVMISLLFGRGATGVACAVALTHWPSITRIVRAEVKQIATMKYVKTAEKLGQSKARIAVFHVVPHVFSQFIVGLVLLFPHAIMHEAAVTFLGFGLSMDSPAIGVILSESMKYITAGQWWLGLFPGLLLVLIVLMFHLLGKNAEVLLNPHTGQQ